MRNGKGSAKHPQIGLGAGQACGIQLRKMPAAKFFSDVSGYD